MITTYQIKWTGMEYVLKARGSIIAHGSYLKCCGVRRACEALGLTATD